MIKSYFLVYDKIPKRTSDIYFSQSAIYSIPKRAYDILFANKGDRLFRYVFYKYFTKDTYKRDNFNKYKNIDFKFEHGDVFALNSYTYLLNVKGKMYILARSTLQYKVDEEPLYYIPELPGVIRKVIETNFKYVDEANRLYDSVVTDADTLFLDNRNDLDQYKALWDEHILDLEYLYNKSSIFNNSRATSSIYNKFNYELNGAAFSFYKTGDKKYYVALPKNRSNNLNDIKPSFINVIKNTKIELRSRIDEGIVEWYPLLSNMYGVNEYKSLHIDKNNIDLFCELLDYIYKDFSFYNDIQDNKIVHPCRLDKQAKKEKAKEQKIDVTEKKEPWWYKFL